MLSHDLTSIRNHWLGVLRGDVAARGPVGIADLVNALGACIAQAEALERGIVPETAALPAPARDTRPAQAVVCQRLAELPTGQRARAEAVIDVVTAACGRHLEPPAEVTPLARRRGGGPAGGDAA